MRRSILAWLLAAGVLLAQGKKEEPVGLVLLPGGAFAPKWLTPCTSTSTLGAFSPHSMSHGASRPAVTKHLKCTASTAPCPATPPMPIRPSISFDQEAAGAWKNPRHACPVATTGFKVWPISSTVSCMIPNPSPVPPTPGTCWTSCSRRCVRRRRDKRWRCRPPFNCPWRHPEEECTRR